MIRNILLVDNKREKKGKLYVEMGIRKQQRDEIIVQTEKIKKRKRKSKSN
jgi:hypothetical protein